MDKTYTRNTENTSGTRHEDYEALLDKIKAFPADRACRCPACATAFGNRHGLRVHFIRKHGGTVWNSTGKAAGRKPAKKKKRKYTRRTPTASAAAPAAHSAVNYCPSCGFDMTILRAAMKVAEGMKG